MTQITGDYVKQFNAKRITDPARSALVIIDYAICYGASYWCAGAEDES